MGLAALRLVFLFLCCLQCCFLLSPAPFAHGLSLYKMYPYDEQALETLQNTLALDGDDESQIVKRKPNNNRFFLKGLRGKRSPLPAQPSMQQAQR